MDDKEDRRTKLDASERRYKRRLQTKQNIWSYAWKYRSISLTFGLIAVIIVLLIGVATELPGLTNNVTPVGAITLNYSSFLKQVQIGNVHGVVIQGNNVQALLNQPLQQNSSSAKLPATTDADYADWVRSFSASTPLSVTASAISPSYTNRVVYTRVAGGGQNYLLSVLNESHAQVEVLPLSQSTSLLVLFLKFLPVLAVLAIMLVFFFPRRRQDPMASMNEHLQNVGKSKAHRYENSKEVVSPTPTKRNSTPSRSATTTTATKSKALVSTVPHVTFADVAGIDEVRADLIEMVQFLQNPDRFERLGAHIPHGALLVGPPGTGKTLLAKAVAGEARVPFFSMSASEFVEMFVGVGASRVRDLFEQARRIAPCVVFIDEIDAVGRKRSTKINGNDERDQTLNQLLVELDGFTSREAVVVLAATNRVDILDSALLRPGRFDRRIMVSPPDRVGREAILRVHSRSTPLAEDVELERLARLTTGMTGADLANLVNEAALAAARRELQVVTHECFEDALARVQLGALRPLIMSEAERRIIAIHEGGHALVAHHLPEADTVNRVTILPRGQSLGVTQFTSEVDRYNYSRETLMARIAVGLGGRVAEELTFGAHRITTGAENDLQVVTDLARKMVTRWGMSERVGVIFADYQPGQEHALNMRNANAQTRTLVVDEDGQVLINGQIGPQQLLMTTANVAPSRGTNVSLQAVIDTEVLRLLDEGRELARHILTEHVDQLTLLADELMEHEQLDRTQFEALLNS
ncbi:MAG TPA: ATP-dependent zinc metalloprotease FtsH [Dictyobacter sp.]|jgi:cell division protease FtsH|nr:ATP-dependent zinc metalloprotease FtsH [Dictyobacter sp.]